MASSKGQFSDAAGNSTSRNDQSTTGEVSLLEFLDSTQLNCLNEAPQHGIKKILSRGKTVSDSFLKSDVDEQLLLNIYFNQAVRVRSITIQSLDLASGPKDIKLFTNKPSIGFEDVEGDQEAAQILSLTEDDVKDGKKIPLKFVRFQSVNSLHVFVASNQGGEEETRIDSLNIFGVPVHATKDLRELRKAPEEQ